jgi:hypothetical protein
MATVQNLAGDSANVAKGTDPASYALLTSSGNVNAEPSLSAATTGNGNTVDFGSAVSYPTFQVVANGTVTGGAVQFQVSLDGVNWSTLPAAGTSLPSAGLVTLSSTALTTNTIVVATGEVALVSTNVPTSTRFARAIVSTTIAGGGSVTVTISAS